MKKSETSMPWSLRVLTARSRSIPTLRSARYSSSPVSVIDSHPTQTVSMPHSRAALSMREPSGARTGARLPNPIHFFLLPLSAVKSSMARSVLPSHQMFSSPLMYILPGMASTSRTTSSMGRMRILEPKTFLTVQKLHGYGQPRAVLTMRKSWPCLSIP